VVADRKFRPGPVFVGVRSVSSSRRQSQNSAETSMARALEPVANLQILAATHT